MKEGKAPGPDRISYEFYKNASPRFLEKVVEYFNLIMAGDMVPESFKQGIIFALHKKGDFNIVSNYRGITFLNSLAKIFTGVLYNRLESWVEENGILNEYQAGFRKNYSTVDNIFVLSSIVKLQLNKNKGKVYAFFVDFQAAFDSVDRSALIYKLYNLGVSSKLIRIIEQLYQNTKVAVWSGKEISEWFNTTSGVRQGCLLSPLLFALYLNDLNDALKEGMITNDIEIRLLMYADDIVLLADNPQKLQRMINRLDNYCQFWKLIINMEKSKIMVFRKGGKLSRQESWSIGDTNIEVVNNYKYLGVELVTNLSFQNHVKKRLGAAKASINSTWYKISANSFVPPSAKYKVFQAVAQSILCYGAQIWGFEQYENVERLLRWFLKRLFGLPPNTPNYMLFIETGLNRVYLTTLKLHFDYICRAMNYPQSRLPHKLAREAIKTNIFWAEEWVNLFHKTGIVINLESFQFGLWKSQLKELTEKLKELHWDEHLALARMSQYHDLYCKLNYTNVPNYFRDEYEIYFIRLIFKVRGGLLNLNAKPWKSNTTGNCSLCNLNAPENTKHFIGRCPILKDIRYIFLGKIELDENEILQFLNGSDYMKLFKYIRNALAYRQTLVLEYNC